jgi:hypothetical protein
MGTLIPFQTLHENSVKRREKQLKQTHNIKGMRKKLEQAKHPQLRDSFVQDFCKDTPNGRKASPVAEKYPRGTFIPKTVYCACAFNYEQFQDILADVHFFEHLGKENTRQLCLDSRGSIGGCVSVILEEDERVEEAYKEALFRAVLEELERPL